MARETQPDVACLQEIKCANNDFPHEALRSAGYGAIWRGQGPHHGVAILARDVDPLETRRDLPGYADDVEARYIEAAVGGVLIGCIYLPNGNPQPGPKFTYKLAWFERLILHSAELRRSGAPVVLAGDYNVVPTDADIYSLRSWSGNALVQPEPRAAFAALLAIGWTDAVRHVHPDEPCYTFWDYKRDAWKRDAGMRLDHLLISRDLEMRLDGAGVDRGVRGWGKPERSRSRLGRTRVSAPSQRFFRLAVFFAAFLRLVFFVAVFRLAAFFVALLRLVFVAAVLRLVAFIVVFLRVELFFAVFLRLDAFLAVFSVPDVFFTAFLRPAARLRTPLGPIGGVLTGIASISLKQFAFCAGFRGVLRGSSGVCLR